MRRRRAIVVFIVSSVVLILLGGAMPRMVEESLPVKVQPSSSSPSIQSTLAKDALEKIEVKGRAPKTGYERAQFGDGWLKVNGCSTRDIILNRDLSNVVLDSSCKVVSGVLTDPYTGVTINFTKEASSKVQIDHVVALSDAWQKGAQQLPQSLRIQLANDPLELLAVDGAANQQKSDGDAATWLPKNRAFRCEYVTRQIAIKIKYSLWVTAAEKDAMVSVLTACPTQTIP